MKKIILILLSVVLLVAGYGFGESEVTFDGSYVDVDTAVVKETFRGILPNLGFSEADVIVQDICAHTGSSLYLDEQKTGGDIQYYSTLDNSVNCKIDRKTGDIFYRKHVDIDGPIPGLPSKTNAPALAKQHLKALGLYKNKMGDPIVTTIEEAFFNGQVTVRYEKTRVVTFTRKISGIPVKGASRAVVMLGANGDLDGMFVRWMDVKSEKITGKLAKSEMKAFLKSQLKSRGEANSIRIKKSSLVLYDNGKGVIEPALVLEGEVTIEGGTFGSNWMLPVLTDPKAEY